MWRITIVILQSRAFKRSVDSWHRPNIHFHLEPCALTYWKALQEKWFGSLSSNCTLALSRASLWTTCTQAWWTSLAVVVVVVIVDLTWVEEVLAAPVGMACQVWSHLEAARQLGVKTAIILFWKSGREHWVNALNVVVKLYYEWMTVKWSENLHFLSKRFP